MFEFIADIDDIRRDNREDSGRYQILADPLAGAREDYRRLCAHYRMVYDAGLDLMSKAQKASAQAHEYFDEAQRIHEQMEAMERLMAEEIA